MMQRTRRVLHQIKTLPFSLIVVEEEAVVVVVIRVPNSRLMAMVLVQQTITNTVLQAMAFLLRIDLLLL